MTSFGGVGNRKTVAKFNSELSGEILVEDIEMGEDEWFRRLLFQSNLSVVQSGKKKKEKIEIEKRKEKWIVFSSIFFMLV